MGFLDRERSRVDRRSVRVKLTEKSREVCDTVCALYEKHMRSVEQVGGISADEFVGLNKVLHRLERFWTDQILYSAVTSPHHEGGTGLWFGSRTCNTRAICTADH